jgi:hypothetical protein
VFVCVCVCVCVSWWERCFRRRDHLFEEKKSSSCTEYHVSAESKSVSSFTHRRLPLLASVQRLTNTAPPPPPRHIWWLFLKGEKRKHSNFLSWELVHRCSRRRRFVLSPVDWETGKVYWFREKKIVKMACCVGAIPHFFSLTRTVPHHRICIM